MHHTAQEDLILGGLLLQPLLNFSFRQPRFWGGALIGGLESGPLRGSIEGAQVQGLAQLQRHLQALHPATEAAGLGLLIEGRQARLLALVLQLIPAAQQLTQPPR